MATGKTLVTEVYFKFQIVHIGLNRIEIILSHHSVILRSAVVLATLGPGAVSAGGRGSVPVEGGGGAVAADPLLLGAPAPWPAPWSASCGRAAVSAEAGLATIRAGGSAPAKLCS